MGLFIKVISQSRGKLCSFMSLYFIGTYLVNKYISLILMLFNFLIMSSTRLTLLLCQSRGSISLPIRTPSCIVLHLSTQVCVMYVLIQTAAHIVVSITVWKTRKDSRHCTCMPSHMPSWMVWRIYALIKNDDAVSTV